MTLDDNLDKCKEYQKLIEFETLFPDDYQQIRLYANGCLNQNTKYVENGTVLEYKAKPKQDLEYLKIVVDKYNEYLPEYKTALNGLYERMKTYVKSNSNQKPNVSHKN